MFYNFNEFFYTYPRVGNQGHAWADIIAINWES